MSNEAMENLVAELVKEYDADLAKFGHRVPHTLVARIETLRMHVENRLTLDTPTQVFFYEQDHYYLSNFSSFGLDIAGRYFRTAEHAYQWHKFDVGPQDSAKLSGADVAMSRILRADSAHDAYKIAAEMKAYQRSDWEVARLIVMGKILRHKVRQHSYVRRKLLETGDRELIENSWRDPFWGWGPKRDGENALGKLWMNIRTELRTGRLGD